MVEAATIVTPKPPVDPNISLPPAVRAQIERADALQRQLNGEAPPPHTNGEAPPQLPAEVTADPRPEPAPITEPPPEDESEQSYEKRYKAMKGRYEKEVPRLKAQIDTLAGETSNLRAVLATMEVRASASDPPPRTTKSLLTPEEIQDYGEDFFNVVEKKARELIEPITEQYEARVKGLEQQIKGVGTQVAESATVRMESTLDHDVPDWRSVNTNWETNGFKEWLQLPDPYSGAIRHQLLNAAYERCDTPRVAAFFKGFHAEVAATAPERDVSDPAPAIPAAPKIPLADLAAPGRAKTAAPAGPAEKPIITRALIKQFYDDITAGHYRGREAEQAQNERIIFEATREGRIRN